MLLVEPAEAARLAAEIAAARQAAKAVAAATAGATPAGSGTAAISARAPEAAGNATLAATGGTAASGAVTHPAVGARTAPARSFRGVADVNATLAKSRLNTLAEEIIVLLASDPNATVRVTVEIDASFPQGVSDSLRRSVSENANSLQLRTKDWET